MRYVAKGGLATESVGGELLVCDAASTSVHRLSGEGRRYFELVSDGPAELPDDAVTSALVDAGVIAPLQVGVSRRQAIAMGAAAAAAVGVVTVGLPSAAAAQSPGPPPPSPSFPEAPTGGTQPGPDSDELITAQITGLTARRVRFEWLTAEGADVRFNWRLYSPGTLVEGNLVQAGGPVDGRTPLLTVSGLSLPQTYLWMITAAGGQTTFYEGTFS